MTGLRIGRSPDAGPTVTNDIVLPLDILGQSTGVLAKKGAGKTNLGVVIVEEAYKAGVPVVVVDPKGDWYGIRAGADGSPTGGLPLPVFGGLHGDIPLEPTAGIYLATLVRERGLSLVLDVSEFSGADRRRFLTAFADRLYRIDSREPMLLMLEEAHEYIPQGVTGEDAKMVGVFERIVKLGRWKGIGIMMMTQRSASLNKNVLTQVDNLFMMRTGSPQDRAAVQAWISGHGDAKEIIDSLPGLATGEFWLWQPERGEPVRGRARMRSTYDAGATPKIGESPRPSATLADVDLGEIEIAMHATIERVKADDPKVLRAKIALLERSEREIEAKLDTALTKLAAEKPEPVVIERLPGWYLDTLNTVRELATSLLNVTEQGIAAAAKLDVAAVSLREQHDTPEDVIRRGAVRPSAALVSPQPAPVRQTPQRITSTAAAPTAGDVHLRTGAHRMVESLGRMAPLRLTKAQWGTVAKLKTTGGTWTAYFGDIKRAGFLDENFAGFTLTDAGFEYLGGAPEPMTPEELQDHYRSILRTGAAKMLDSIMDAYPNGITKEELGEAAGIVITGGTFTAYLGDIVRNGLAVKDGNEIRATDILMHGATTA